MRRTSLSLAIGLAVRQCSRNPCEHLSRRLGALCWPRNSFRLLSSSLRSTWPTETEKVTEGRLSAFDNRLVAINVQACPGCGALAQTVEPGEAGHYSSKRKVVRSFVEYKTGAPSPAKAQDEIVVEALQRLTPEQSNLAGLVDRSDHGTTALQPIRHS